MSEDLTNREIIKARSCTLCSGLGYFRAKSKSELENVGEYVFLCLCEAGQRSGKRYPRWNAHLKTKYKPDFER